jgi:regulator of protease activity HflC (stomatin/prohibitin superfamily)
MLFLKYTLILAGFGLLAGAAAVLFYDIYQATQFWRLLARRREGAAPEVPLPAPRAIRWHAAGRLAALAWLPLLAGLSITVVPSGMAGVRVSQLTGTRPGTLYPGIHFIFPLLERVALYDIRDRVYVTAVAPPDDPKKKAEVLGVHTKEGLSLGMAIAVRYRLDTKRLDLIHENLPQPVDDALVAPAVASVFRQVVPNFRVREVFATRREEIRQQAAEIITAKLAADGVLVKEVMLRDIQLPPEYAQGLEELLLKEQENERLVYEIEIKQKRVRTAELEAEAEKTRQVKRAEAEGQVRVLQARAEADAMQHTLPLKEKQIQQSRLEAEARKEATLKNAEAAAQAKVIDSRAELERRKLLAEAEANRIRVTSAADAERLRLEAAVLRQNPLLIQKIIAERLSDKVQIMMVPMDGKFFFANDVLRAPQLLPNAAPAEEPEDPPAQRSNGRPPAP